MLCKLAANRGMIKKIIKLYFPLSFFLSSEENSSGKCPNKCKGKLPSIDRENVKESNIMVVVTFLDPNS